MLHYVTDFLLAVIEAFEFLGREREAFKSGPVRQQLVGLAPQGLPFGGYAAGPPEVFARGDQEHEGVLALIMSFDRALVEGGFFVLPNQ